MTTETKYIDLVSKNAKEHRDTWREKSEFYWLARLVEEVGELSSSLVHHHEHPPELELIEIAAICINWLDLRDSRERKYNQSSYERIYGGGSE